MTTTQDIRDPFCPILAQHTAAHIIINANASSTTGLVSDDSIQVTGNTQSIKAVKTRPNNNMKAWWECPGCNTSVKTRAELTNHIRQTHADPNYGSQSQSSLVCQHCTSTRQYANRAGLMSHIKATHPNIEAMFQTTMKCRFCEKLFERPNELAKHAATHSDYRQYRCADCNYTTNHRSSLLRHMGKIHTQSLWQCHECGLQFEQENILLKHLAEDHSYEHSPDKERTCKAEQKQKSFPCDWPGCCRVFTLNIFLQKHRRSHNKSKTPQAWPCNICGRHYKTADMLKQHKRGMHSKPQDYFKCTECDMRFKWRTGLRDHKKLFKCKVFQLNPFEIKDSNKDRGNLNMDLSNGANHKNTNNMGKEPDDIINGDPGNVNQVPDNGNITNRKSVKKKSGKGVFTCEFCALTYSYSGGLKQHINKHHRGITYKCAECSKVYGAKDELTQHIKSAHCADTQYQCMRCGQQFKLRRQYKKHLDRKIKCAPVFLGPRLQAPGSLTEHTPGSLGQQAPGSLGLQAPGSFGQHTCSTPSCLGQQATGDIISSTDSNGQPASKSIGQQPGHDNNMIGQETSNPISYQGSNFIGQQGSNSIGQQGSNSIGQQGSNSIGQQGSNSIGQQGSNSISQQGSNPISYQGSNSIGQQGSNSIGQQGSNSIGQQTSNSISQGHSVNSTGGEETLKVARPKIHACDECKKSFTSKSGLRYHKLGIHLREYKYKCSTCQKGFVTKGILREHERLHSNVPSVGKSSSKKGRIILIGTDA